MAKPFRWNTLEQAASWLSEKTKEAWTEARLIDFAIKYCRPDDISEDIKYPTYLRTILPESLKDLLLWVSLCQGDSSDNAYVCKSVRVNGENKKATTYLFKDNLVDLQKTGKSTIKYISWNDESAYSHDEEFTKDAYKPVTIYCELRPIAWCVDDPPKFPSIPLIQVDIASVGIRDVELKQLLRDYLSFRTADLKQLPNKYQQIGYGLIDPLSLHDAGYLICGLTPLPPVGEKNDHDPNKEIRYMASAVINQLISDAKAKKLKVETSNGEDAISIRDRKPEGRFGKDFLLHYGTQWFVTRSDLKEWVAKKGLKPVFLYPEIEENSPRTSAIEESSTTEEKTAAYKLTITPNDTELSSGIEQKMQRDGCFDECDCSLFDPMNRKQIALLFTSISEDGWKKLFNRAHRTPLKFARHGDEKPYKYNPVRVANWLYCDGKYSLRNLARILANNLPSRSKEQRDDFMEKYELYDRYN